MSLSNEDINPRRMRDASEEEALQVNVTHRRPHHCHRRGDGATTRLTAKVAQMATSMIDIEAQNITIHELLIQAQGQQGLQTLERSYRAHEQPLLHTIEVAQAIEGSPLLIKK